MCAFFTCFGFERPADAQGTITAREMGQSIGGLSPRTIPVLPKSGEDTREMGVWHDEYHRPDVKEYSWDDHGVGYLVAPPKLHLSGRVSAGWQYDDNIGIDEVATQKSGSIAVQPSLSLSYGPNSWGLAASLSYGADLQWYLDDVDKSESFSHSGGLSVSWTGAKLRASLGLGFGFIDGADIDAGEQTQRTTISGSLNVGYDLTGKTTIGVSFPFEVLDYSGAFFSSNSVTGQFYVDYKMRPKVTVGMQFGYGVIEVVDGSDSTSYSASLRANWAATEKWGVHASAGAENRSYSSGDDSVHPIFDLGINGDLFSTNSGKTSFGVSTYSGFHPSAALKDQGYYSIGVMANLTQRWGERLSASVGFGYEYSDYLATDQAGAASRVDHYYYVRPNISYAVTNHFSLSLFYQYSINQSEGFGASSFQRDNYGIMANFSF